MSEEIKPDVTIASDVESAENEIREVSETVLNYAEKTLAEISELFEGLMSDPERVRKSKEAEALKAAFYKKLSKEKTDAGLPDSDAGLQDGAAAGQEEGGEAGPFKAIEEGFKSLYNAYRKERAEFTRRSEEEKQENLVRKQAVIDELKNLVEKQEDVSAAFPEFRELQARWRSVGPVPAQNFRVLNDTYQFYVEQFYDKVQINRDMRDLDFRKNLEAKQRFCELAEKLSENENVIDAFKELQKLHEQWKEFGPVAKEFRDEIWDRFKAATAVINKKYQSYFEGQKEQQARNLDAKTALCEQVEAIAGRTDVRSSNEWNSLSREIEEIQKTWKTIGYATRKENQKIYDRFRAACDRFFENKRVFYTEFKDSMNDNMEKKLALIEQAEALKSSTDWKKATDQFIVLQKKWKEIGAVPRKKSEQMWKRFRTACDEFFEERDKQAKPENSFYANLKAKKALIAEIEAFRSDDQQVLRDAMNSFTERWKEIGFVPFKEKDSVSQAFKEAMQAAFPEFGNRQPRSQRSSRGASRPVLSEKDRLVQEHGALQQQIDTYENNIGFFAASKNSQPLIQQMRERIDQAKEELRALEARIREIENAQDQE